MTHTLFCSRFFARSRARRRPKKNSAAQAPGLLGMNRASWATANTFRPIAARGSEAMPNCLFLKWDSTCRGRISCMGRVEAAGHVAEGPNPNARPIPTAGSNERTNEGHARLLLLLLPPPPLVIGTGTTKQQADQRLPRLLLTRRTRASSKQLESMGLRSTLFRLNRREPRSPRVRVRASRGAVLQRRIRFDSRSRS